MTIIVARALLELSTMMESDTYRHSGGEAGALLPYHIRFGQSGMFNQS